MEKKREGGKSKIGQKGGLPGCLLKESNESIRMTRNMSLQGFTFFLSFFLSFFLYLSITDGFGFSVGVGIGAGTAFRCTTNEQMIARTNGNGYMDGWIDIRTS